MKMNQTAYNVAFDTDLPFFDDLSQDPKKTEEFAKYMKNVRSSETVHIKHLVSGYEWKNIVEGGLVVDVGGSTGTGAIALAEAFPQLKFVVQDLPSNAENGAEAANSLPETIRSRINFESHDFMEPQQIQGASVYLFRMILHDWPDNQTKEILRNVVNAMDRHKSKLLIMDSVLLKPGTVPLSVERLVRVRDLTMMQAFNSRERDLDDWEALLLDTDPRLHLVEVRQPFNSAMSVLEIELLGKPQVGRG